MSAKRTNPFSEHELLEVASQVCMTPPGNILLIGGGTILPEIVKFRRLRCRSNDLDFVMNDRGLEEILPNYRWEKEISPFNQSMNNGIYSTYINTVFTALFHNEIRGYYLPADVFSGSIAHRTSKGEIYTVRPELNIALKVRRGISKGHIYGKDGLDFASTVWGMKKQGKQFDTEAFARYLSHNICSSCTLCGEVACVNSLGGSNIISNLQPSERAEYVNVIESCKERLSPTCRH